MNARFKSALKTFALTASLLSVPSVHAEKPEWAGERNGKNEKREKSEKRERDDRNEYRGRDDDRHEYRRRSDDDRRDSRISIGVHFGDRERLTVREYYHESFTRGSCPPGLAKKQNGCMPPGLAKKWKRGSPLPRGVVYYDLPPELEIRLGTPPSGHRYVRVAGDILLIAIGTAMVVDAIEDLSRM